MDSGTCCSFSFFLLQRDKITHRVTKTEKKHFHIKNTPQARRCVCENLWTFCMNGGTVIVKSQEKVFHLGSQHFHMILQPASIV